MKTIAELLSSDATRIKEDVRILLGEYSEISLKSECRSIVVISPYGNNFWSELGIEGRRLQAKILKNYKTYHALVHALIRGLTNVSQRKFDEAAKLIRQNVEQDNSTWYKTITEAIEKTMAAFDDIETICNHLYSSDEAFLVIPDTNTLLARPDIDGWMFDWCTSFEIVFTPTVLAELDQLKVSHKNTDVRSKAESVIRRIKELGRRGDLHTGVPVVTDRITASCIAMEPNIGESLPWLDASNNDDRILASVVELTRENTRSVVVIVTADINLQNKARFARMPFCELPMMSSDIDQKRENSGE